MTAYWTEAELWRRIEEAAGDREVFREGLRELDEPELRSLHLQLCRLAEALVRECFDRLPPEAREEDVLNLEERALWVVARGRDRYEAVRADPSIFPSREEARGRSFASAVIASYTSRFGPFQALER